MQILIQQTFMEFLLCTRHCVLHAKNNYEGKYGTHTQKIVFDEVFCHRDDNGENKITMSWQVTNFSARGTQPTPTGDILLPKLVSGKKSVPLTSQRYKFQLPD